MSFVGRPLHPISGRQLWIQGRTRAELDAYLHRIASLRTELRLGMKTVEQVDHELRHMRHGAATLERASVSYLRRVTLAANTKHRVRGLLRTHMRSLLPRPVASLDAAVLAPWIESLAAAGLHPTTIAMIWRTLRSLVSHACERGWIGALPWGAWRPRLSRAPKRAQREAARSVEEFARIVLAARELDDEAIRYLAAIWPGRPPLAEREAMIATTGLLGLRSGELAGLRWEDVDYGKAEYSFPPRVRIARQWNDKPLKGGAQPRWIATIPDLIEILERHRARLHHAKLFAPDGPIFPSRKSVAGHPRHYTAGPVLTSLNLRAAVERAQIPSVGGWSAHSLRDTFVTLEAAGAQGDLARVAARTRHASIANLARYLRALSRDPAPPAVRFLPGSTTSDAGIPLLGSHETEPSKETPP